MTSFLDFGLAAPITRALAEERYETPTPIQAQTIPIVLEGRDLIGIAQTGTGKTAAFALPILNRLAAGGQRPHSKSCRVLVLSPTRELSGQILDSFRTYGRHLRVSSALAIGGVSLGAQVRALMGGVDVLVATPGRLLDLRQQNALKLDQVEVFVLDEADRMLDMGFINDIRKIVAKLPKERQTLLFSATMPQAIAELAGEMLRDPAKVAVTPAATTVDTVDQRVVHVDRGGKTSALTDLLRREPVDRALVFTRTKRGADKVARSLGQAGIRAGTIHGNKSQNNRERALAAFRDGSVRTLVATDIAARGIDVDGITHVFNFDLPHEPESYVHRIGRTARAGATGIAISLCSADEAPLLRAIEKLIRMAIPATGTVPQAPAHGHEQHHRGHPRPNGDGQSQRPRGNRGRRGRHGGPDQRQANSAGPRAPHAAQPGGQGRDHRENGSGGRGHQPRRSRNDHPNFFKNLGGGPDASSH